MTEQPQRSGVSADSQSGLRLGIDLGGTKIEGLVVAPDGSEVARRRVHAPRDAYSDTLAALTDLISTLERQAGVGDLPVGIGIPGSLSPTTGQVRNANSTWLNGQSLKQDLEARLSRSVAIANDADCFALSEATDGAGAGKRTVIGIILGTGVGSGIVVDGRLLRGPLGIAGEWGHNGLPDPAAGSATGDAPRCWCGRIGCIESYVSGPALERDYATTAGMFRPATDVAARASQGDGIAARVINRHSKRLARGLASLVNILDPDVVVLGGGLSRMAHLYETLPSDMAAWVFSDQPKLAISPPAWGDASGVRGAAWLNPLPATAEPE